MGEKITFCQGGGCTAKLGAGILSRVLERLPKGPEDPNLLIGYDSKDDAAVYKVSDDIAIVQTLDFFPPMVEDPYTFGKIAATNALSDIYAMGGEVKTALNIVCFPEQMDLNILGEIMRGGSEKVIEAGGTLAGGHSINDTDVKYGLSVTGVVHPDKIYPNNGGKPGDKLILTKKLGVGIISTANRVQEALQDCDKELTVAVMGCVVNGPGEAREADIGIAGGDGCGVLFVHGELKEKLPMTSYFLPCFDTLTQCNICKIHGPHPASPGGAFFPIAKACALRRKQV